MVYLVTVLFLFAAAAETARHQEDQKPDTSPQLGLTFPEGTTAKTPSTQTQNDGQNPTLLRHLLRLEHARWGRIPADAEVSPTLSLDKSALALTQQHNDYSDHMGMQSLTSLRFKSLSDAEREEKTSENTH